MNNYKFNLKRFRGALVGATLGMLFNSLFLQNQMSKIVWGVATIVFSVVLFMSFYCFEKVEERVDE